MLCRMAESNPAQVTTPAGLSKAKVIIIKIIALTAISLALIFAQGWAAPRYYQPDYVAGFYTGLLEGALMPAALPGLLGGKDVPIYAPNNVGRGYKIGYILGLNTCGTFFFGVAFWQPRENANRKSIGPVAKNFHHAQHAAAPVNVRRKRERAPFLFVNQFHRMFGNVRVVGVKFNLLAPTR